MPGQGRRLRRLRGARADLRRRREYDAAENTQELTDDVLGIPLGTWLVALGRGGYVAKGIAFCVAGGLLVFAAVTSDVSTATGLDGAINAIGAVPTGQWLLTAVALSFLAFGVYAPARARYPDRDPST